jgi:hypothetical protein
VKISGSGPKDLTAAQVHAVIDPWYSQFTVATRGASVDARLRRLGREEIGRPLTTGSLSEQRCICALVEGELRRRSNRGLWLAIGKLGCHASSWVDCAGRL